MGPPDVQPLDLTKLEDHHSVHFSSKTHATEIGNRVFVHIVYVKDDKVGSEITLVLACLQENAKVGIKK